MALHGTVVRTDGTVLELSIGKRTRIRVVGITRPAGTPVRKADG